MPYSSQQKVASRRVRRNSYCSIQVDHFLGPTVPRADYDYTVVRQAYFLDYAQEWICCWLLHCRISPVHAGEKGGLASGGGSL